MSGKNTSSWNNPSAANQAKYHLTPLPGDFEPTEEEKGLLKMYETIKRFEREAKRLKEQESRKKLEEKEAQFQKEKQKKKRDRRRKKDTQARDAGDGGNESSMSDGSYDSSDDDQIKRRAKKIEALRDEVEEKRMAMASEETKAESMREKMLGTNEDIELGPSLKRKRVQGTDDSQDLLTNMMKTQTPPHEFSDKLEIKAWKGKVLFPSVPDHKSWIPPQTAKSPNDGAFLVELDDFDISKATNGTGNNTLAIKFNAPTDSKRFSINIAGPDHDDFNSVLFHFNPRQYERGGQLVVNDKQEGIWGQSIALPLSQVPLMFGQTSVTLQIQINGDGFDIFIEDRHCARLEHRKELPSKPCSLFLQFPSCDDYGSPENWIVYKAWWGNKASMVKGDISNVAGVNSFNAIHPRKLFISQLPKISTEAEVDVRRAELERAFRKYGGARGVTCVVPTNTTFAFVEMETERMADLALVEMANKYRLNRARRSRHEALQEERAAAEAAKQGKTQDSGGW